MAATVAQDLLVCGMDLNDLIINEYIFFIFFYRQALCGQLRSDLGPVEVEVEVELIVVSGEKRNRTAEAIIASNTVSDRRVPKVMRIKMKTRYDHDG